MILQYYFSSAHQPFSNDPANAGLDEVPSLLEHAEAFSFQVEQIDTANWSDQQRSELYSMTMKAILARPPRERYAIREVFGSRRRGMGPYFGREVPALLVLEEECKQILEVYPHRRKGQIVTVRDGLWEWIKRREDERSVAV